MEVNISDEGFVNKDCLIGTRASSNYYELKQDILSGRLKPGSKLRLNSLKDDYNIGSSPLREALNRLTANGMVCQLENKGFRVSPISIDELDDIVKTRCMLEEVALRQSINKNDDAYYERIILLTFRLSRAERDYKINTCSSLRDDLHKDFHQAILSGCESKLLIKYCLSLYEQTLRYSNLIINEKCRQDQEEKDHQAICDAILNRNADEAIQLLRSHYQITKDLIIKSDNLI